MNSLKWLSDDKQLFWQSMVAAFREVGRNTEQSLRTRTRLMFVDSTLLIALHEVEDGILHVDKTRDRLKWNHPRAPLYTNRLEKRGFIHIEDRGKDPDSDYVVVPIGVGRHVFAEAASDYVDTVRKETTSSLANEDREVMLRCLQAVLDRK